MALGEMEGREQLGISWEPFSNKRASYREIISHLNSN